MTMKNFFSLNEALAYARHLLPTQGPIQDFIHHNTLHAFQDQPFEKAVLLARDVYGGQAYMPLSYYRNAFQKGRISERQLRLSLHREMDQNHQEYPKELLQNALFNYIEIKDQNALNAAAKQKGIPRQEIEFHLGIVHTWGLCIPNRKPTIRSVIKKQLAQEDWDRPITSIFLRLLSAYLDQGISRWQLPSPELPFFDCIGKLVQDSALPIATFVSRQTLMGWFSQSPENVIETLLNRIVGNEKDYTSYLTDTLLAHPGWSGMVCTIENKPASLLKNRPLRLVDCVAVKLILEWEWIQSNATFFKPCSIYIQETQKAPPPIPDLSLALWFAQAHLSMEQLQQWKHLWPHLNTSLLTRIWHHAFESTYYEEVLYKIKAHANSRPETEAKQNPTVQALFCIDDRECSFRRHLEEQNPRIQTFGTAGFFGLDFYFQSIEDIAPVQMCPVQLQPQHVVKEIPAKGFEEIYEKQKQKKKQKAIALNRFQEASTSIFFGFVAANTLGHASILRLILCFLNPARLLRSLRTKQIDIPTQLCLLHHPNAKSDHLQQGFTHEEMANRVYHVLQSIGLTDHFAPLVVVIAHGSSSVNNPHFAAYDCGACSGKPGSPNARSFASIANLPEVREYLEKMGMVVPQKTHFVGGYHDTCTDLVTFFDTDAIPQESKELFLDFKNSIERTRALNAKERCRRFAVTHLHITPEQAVQEVAHRSCALFEPRPELGHATNALCIVGRRELSKGLFFDRRAFFNSYDPSQDPSGKILNSILNAVIPVCGGINLEYYFSRVDNAVYGCGTKLSHNVCSLLGVYNGVDDDLRTGLPIQMTELHDPIRLLILIEQEPEILFHVLSSNPAVYEWVRHAWVMMACISPSKKEIWSYQTQTGFEKTDLVFGELHAVASSTELIHTSREPIPVYRIDSTLKA